MTRETTSQCRCGCGREVEQHQGKGRQKRYYSDACKQEQYRNRNREKRNKLLRETRSKLFVVPVSLKVANEFVRRYHRHNNPVPISIINIGVIDEIGLLRGVGIANLPIVPQLMDGFTLEVLRVATDGCPNACSVLYGAIRRIAFEMGYCKVITYTLQDESGASMRGSGWKRVSEVKPHKGRGHRPGRIAQVIYTQTKYRWETIAPKKSQITEIKLPWTTQEQPLETLWTQEG